MTDLFEKHPTPWELGTQRDITDENIPTIYDANNKVVICIDDYDLLVLARKNAFELVAKDPMLTIPEHKNIRKELLHKFGESLGLVDIA